MIAVENLSLKQGNFSLRDVSLTIPTGSYGVLMGPSGCGKTSLVEAICGLRNPTAGIIRLDGRDVAEVSPADRGIGYVPQEGALFPRLAVRHQIAFSLVVRRRPDSIIAERVDELASQLGITHLLDCQPDGLSGGERQRVAFARAIADDPPILCLDEPLSALDNDIHAELLTLIKDMRRRLRATTLHVTHNHDEARALADVIIKLPDSRSS